MMTGAVFTNEMNCKFTGNLIFTGHKRAVEEATNHNMTFTINDIDCSRD